MKKTIVLLLLLNIIIVSCSKDDGRLTVHDYVYNDVSSDYYKVSEVGPPKVVKDGVLFTFAENVASVEVAGDFNNWEGSIPLVRGLYGTYYLIWQQPLKAGDYLYRYRVNGIWMNDPLSENTTFDDDNQEISYFVINEDMGFLRSNPIYNTNGTVTFFYSNEYASEVMFTSSDLGFNSSKYAMTKTTNNLWVITINPPNGIYNYNFIVDRDWRVDPLNMNVVLGNDNRLHSQVFISRN